MPVNALSLTGSSFRGGVGAGGGLFLSAVAVCGGWGVSCCRVVGLVVVVVLCLGLLQLLGLCPVSLWLLSLR